MFSSAINTNDPLDTIIGGVIGVFIVCVVVVACIKLFVAFSMSCRHCRNEPTARQEDIILLVCKGKSNKEIAAEAHLTEKTVKNHISHIFGKLGVKSRVELVVHALRHGKVTFEQIDA